MYFADCKMYVHVSFTRLLVNVQAAASQPRGRKYVDNGQVLKIIH